MEIGSRNEKPMTRYFPELVEAVLANLPERCVVDGEIILVGASGDRLDFEVLQQRIHPAASRVKMLSETDAGPVRRVRPAGARRHRLHRAAVRASAAPRWRRRCAGARPPVHLTPATTDRDVAEQWFHQFEGAGLDGVIAKPLDGVYEPDKRVMFKVKHERTADCVVAGYRVHKSGPDRIGSLLLGLYNEAGELASVGVIGAFPLARRAELFEEMQPLVTDVRRPPVGLGEAAGGRPDAAQRRGQPLAGRQGPVVRAAAPGAGGRGPLRPHGGRAVPAHRPVRPLAPGPRPRSRAPTSSSRSR